MRKLLLLALLLTALPASASAADSVVTRDSGVTQVYTRGSAVVYHRSRAGKGLKKRPWMAVVSGKRRRLKRIPRNAAGGDLGRDRRGRLVFTYSKQFSEDGRVRWWIYDVKRQRARRAKGLPIKKRCIVEGLSFARKRSAYSALCLEDEDTGVFLRTGKRKRRVTKKPFDALSLRGATLAGLKSEGDGDYSVHRLVSHGKVCPRAVPTAFGQGDSDWFPTHVFVAGGRIVWIMGDDDLTPLAASPGGPCGPIGKTGSFDFTPETATVRSLAIDGRRLVYTDGKRILRHKLPAKPSFAPPKNDDFEQAIGLATSPPATTTGRTGYATLQPSEQPLDDSSHTVWYAYRPQPNGTFYVKVEGDDFKAGVFTGTSISNLTRVPPDPSGQFTAVNGQAGKTYWIAVGARDYRPVPDYQQFLLSITASPPPLE